MYRLSVGTISIDIGNEGGLILTSNDPLNFTFGKASKTYSIAIANTPNNNNALDNLFNKNFEKTLVWDAVLEVQSLQMQGKLFITSWNSREAQTQFITASGTLWAELAEKNLKTDFTWTELDHELSLANVKATNLEDGDVMYDFIYRGDALQPPLAFDMLKVDIAEMQPAIRVRTILEKIFADYTITQNLFKTAEYNALYLLYCQNQTRNSPGWLSTALAESDILTEDSTAVSDTLSQDETSYSYLFEDVLSSAQLGELLNEVTPGFIEYQASETGGYAMMGRYRINITLSTDTEQTFTNRQYDLLISEYNGANTLVRSVVSQVSAKADVTAGLNVEDTIDFNFDTKILEIAEDHYFKIRLIYAALGPLAATTVNIEYTVKEGTNLNVRPWQGYGAGATVPGEWIVPDLTVSEFLAGLFRTFNMEFHASVERKQIFLTNRDNATPALHNITTVILNDSIEMDETPVKENYELKYTRDGNDDFAEQQFDVFKFSDGSKLISNGARETKEIVSPYSFNAFKTRPPLTIQMTKAVRNDERPKYSTDFNFRLAYYTGKTGWNHELQSGGTTNPTISSEIEYNTFKNAVAGQSLDYSTAEIGIYDMYYKGNIDRLTAGGVITCNIIADFSWLSQIYYVLGKDLRANYIIQRDGFQGKYQLIELDQVKGDIFTAKLFRV